MRIPINEIVVIEGYLTEKKLLGALGRLVGSDWLGCELRIKGSRRRWDTAFRRSGTKVVVEYDGDEHYCNTLKIRSDREKDAFAESNGIRVVRFPYWIQLTNVTLRHCFGRNRAIPISQNEAGNLEGTIQQDFPHGFITTRCRELMELPLDVRADVCDSLRKRAAEHGTQYVIPAALMDLIQVDQ